MTRKAGTILLVFFLAFCLVGAVDTTTGFQLAPTLTINGITYESYGLIDEQEKKKPEMTYQINPVSLILGIVFFETIIAPIYFFGYDLYQPVGLK